jgi:hypothetical protein
MPERALMRHGDAGAVLFRAFRIGPDQGRAAISDSRTVLVPSHDVAALLSGRAGP